MGRAVSPSVADEVGSADVDECCPGRFRRESCARLTRRFRDRWKNNSRDSETGSTLNISQRAKMSVCHLLLSKTMWSSRYRFAARAIKTTVMRHRQTIRKFRSFEGFIAQQGKHATEGSAEEFCHRVQCGIMLFESQAGRLSHASTRVMRLRICWWFRSLRRTFLAAT